MTEPTDAAPDPRGPATVPDDSELAAARAVTPAKAPAPAKTARRPRRYLIPTWVLLGAIAIVLVALWWSWANLAATHIARGIASGGPLFLLFLVPVALAILAVVLCVQAAQSIRGDRKRMVIGIVAGVLVIPVSFFAFFRPLHRWEYESQHAAIAGLHILPSDLPGYQTRISYIEADNYLADFAQGLPSDPGVDNLQYIPQQSQWCALLVNGGMSHGLEGVACVDSRGHVQSAAFTASTPSPKARFAKKLSRRVAALARGTTYSSSDPYGYIGTDGHPTLVVPVKAYTHCPHCYDVPEGDVVWSAAYPHGHYFHNVTVGQLDGPVIGVSTARELRAALTARGSFRQYLGGTYTTQIANNTDTDLLYGNSGGYNDPTIQSSEMLLQRTTGGGFDFVTPLTPSDPNTHTTAVMVVEAGSVTAGHLPAATLYQLPTAQPSITDIVGTIGDRYGSTLGISTVAYNNGTPTLTLNDDELSFYEIVPGVQPNTWVASLGQGGAAEYQVTVSSDLSTCMVRADGTKIGCVKGSSTNALPVGTITGPASIIVPVDESARYTHEPLPKLIAQRDALQAAIDQRAHRHP